MTLDLERKWQPTPVFLLGEFHGQRTLESGIIQSSQLYEFGTLTIQTFQMRQLKQREIK